MEAPHPSLVFSDAIKVHPNNILPEHIHNQFLAMMTSSTPLLLDTMALQAPLKLWLA